MTARSSVCVPACWVHQLFAHQVHQARECPQNMVCVCRRERDGERMGVRANSIKQQQRQLAIDNTSKLVVYCYVCVCECVVPPLDSGGIY